MSDLLNVDEALSRILAHFQPLAAESVPLADALERVLAQDIHAQINLPPYANSSMDGYAVRAADTRGASRDSPARLNVTMDIPAGKTPTAGLASGQAARIMTGAPMPDGADAVIPVEDTDGGWTRGDASLPEIVGVFRELDSGAYVRPAGEDIRTGDHVLSAGTRLRPQEIGILAALGQAEVVVYRRPRVAILSNGSELVEVDQPLTPGKIRDVNGYTLAGLVRENGGEPLRAPIAPDTPEAIRAQFRAALDSKPDMIVSSAGVSVGAADFIHDILGELGEVGFWRINLRPGKPLTFGHLEGVPFFGLPGNPVSTMVTFEVLVRPALLRLLGMDATVSVVHARTAEAMKSDGRRSFIRVKLARRDGELYASSTGTQSSGALMSMVLADGLLIIPEDVREIAAGEALPVRLLKPLPPVD